MTGKVLETQDFYEVSLCSSTTVSTRVSELRKDLGPRVVITMPVKLIDITEKATYSKIKTYVEEHYGFKVHTAYIAEVKRKHGIEMHDAPNKVDQLKHKKCSCPQEKVIAIEDALVYFGIISVQA